MAFVIIIGKIYDRINIPIKLRQDTRLERVNNVITVLLDEDKQFLLTRINLENGTTTIIHQGLEDGTILTNSSHDQQQFLYLSKPERTSKLVKLQ